ncbi:hypothetical protein CAEBREN_08332 [Caenorhabditis brenneri]|uniref:Uncharacterized protein n=1 Tax=Caenorhabditis brenneri TaxID=135651 RepID=G0MAR8_CAEBE|nr:hypothetical protein CAEBREN_08332 [Caenorhabditis brenneri]
MDDDVQILGETPANGKTTSNKTPTDIDADRLVLNHLRDFYKDGANSGHPLDGADLSDELIDAEREMIRANQEYGRCKEEALARKACSQQPENNKRIWESWVFESSEVRPQADQKANLLFMKFLRASNLPPSAFCNHQFQDYIRHLNAYAQVPSCVLNADTIYGTEKKPAGQEKCVLCDEYVSREDAYMLTVDELSAFGSKFVMNGHFQFQELRNMMRRKNKWLCKKHNRAYDAFQLSFKEQQEKKAQLVVVEPSTVQVATPPTVAAPPTAAVTSSAPDSSQPQTSAAPSLIDLIADAPVLAPEIAPAPVVKPKRQRKKKEAAVVQPAPVEPAPVEPASTSTPSPDASSPSSDSASPQVVTTTPTTLKDLLKATTPPKKSRAKKRPNPELSVLDVNSPGLPTGSQVPSLTIAQRMANTVKFPPLQLQAPIVTPNSTPSFLSPPPFSYPTPQYNLQFPPQPPAPNSFITSEPVFKKPCLPQEKPAPKPRSRKPKDPNAPPRRRGGDTRSKQTSSDATISSTPLPGAPPGAIATSSQPRANIQFTDLPPVLSPVQSTARSLDQPGQQSPATTSPQKQEPSVNFFDMVGSMDLYPKGLDVPFIADTQPKITNVAEETLTKKQAEEFEDILKKYSTGDSGSSSSSSPESRRPTPSTNSDPGDAVQDFDQSLMWNPNGNPDESLMLDFDTSALADLMKHN